MNEKISRYNIEVEFKEGVIIGRQTAGANGNV